MSDAGSINKIISEPNAKKYVKYTPLFKAPRRGSDESPFAATAGGASCARSASRAVDVNAAFIPNPFLEMHKHFSWCPTNAHVLTKSLLGSPNTVGRDIKSSPHVLDLDFEPSIELPAEDIYRDPRSLDKRHKGVSTGQQYYQRLRWRD
ncbi:Protein of unknown function [Gryllus bimaculatus]|nr:Protein of unknown function [Gryllus bimaculatus]